MGGFKPTLLQAVATSSLLALCPIQLPSFRDLDEVIEFFNICT